MSHKPKQVLVDYFQKVQNNLATIRFNLDKFNILTVSREEARVFLVEAESIISRIKLDVEKTGKAVIMAEKKPVKKK